MPRKRRNRRKCNGRKAAERLDHKKTVTNKSSVLAKLKQFNVKHFGAVHHCKTCSYFSRYLFFICTHVRRHHCNPPAFSCFSGFKYYSCTTCGFRTLSTIKFKQHSEILVKNKEYNCDLCQNFKTYSVIFFFKHRLECEENSEEQEEVKVMLQCIKELHQNGTNQNYVDLKILNESENIFSTTDAENYFTVHSVHDFDRSKMIVKLLPRSKSFKCKLCTYKTSLIGSLNLHNFIEHCGFTTGSVLYALDFGRNS